MITAISFPPNSQKRVAPPSTWSFSLRKVFLFTLALFADPGAATRATLPPCLNIHKRAFDPLCCRDLPRFTSFLSPAQIQQNCRDALEGSLDQIQFEEGRVVLARPAGVPGVDPEINFYMSETPLPPCKALSGKPKEVKKFTRLFLRAGQCFLTQRVAFPTTTFDEENKVSVTKVPDSLKYQALQVAAEEALRQLKLPQLADKAREVKAAQKKGNFIVLPTDIGPLLIGFFPDEVGNYERAFKKAEEFFQLLENKEIETKDLIFPLLEIHRSLLDKQFPLAGKFREIEIFSDMQRWEEVVKEFQALHTPELAKKLNKTYAKVVHCNGKKTSQCAVDFSGLTKEDRELWALANIHINPSPSELPQIAQNFIEKLRKAIDEMEARGRLDPIALAAYMQREFGLIHMVSDGNGRLGLATTLPFLIKHGYPPSLFLNKIKYIQAINQPDSWKNFFQENLKKICKHAKELLQIGNLYKRL